MRLARMLLLAAALIASSQSRSAEPTPTADEKKAIALIVRLGGKAEIDPKLPEAARVSAKFEVAFDNMLVGLKKAPQIGAVDVYDATRCTDKGLAALKELPNLQKLSFGKSVMTLPRAKALGQCKELRRLYLAGCGLTDMHLVALKPLTRLEWLDISDNPITDKGMATVRTFERLRELYLSKTGLTNRGLMELKGLDGLRRLNVGDTKVTADAAEAFASEMPNLQGVRR